MDHSISGLELILRKGGMCLFSRPVLQNQIADKTTNVVGGDIRNNNRNWSNSLQTAC